MLSKVLIFMAVIIPMAINAILIIAVVIGTIHWFLGLVSIALMMLFVRIKRRSKAWLSVLHISFALSSMAGCAFIIFLGVSN